MTFSLPPELHQALDEALCGAADVARATAALSASYRRHGTFRHTSDETRRLAYLTTRLPATYAANAAVLRTLRAAATNFKPDSLLDLGAGPGTALWAAGTAWPELSSATLVEGDAGFIRLGQLLARSVRLAVTWQQGDLRAQVAYAPSDLVTISYTLNELPDEAQKALVQRAWAAARAYLVLVEPGTKAGFSNILRAREELLVCGAQITAPCPQAGPCPLAGIDDWCHFTQRLTRTRQHRHAKGGTLGYEDEKFSYLIAARASPAPAPARIIRHPLRLKGHVKLALCTPAGLQTETCTRSQAAYKKARQAHWGDAWQPRQKNDE